MAAIVAVIIGTVIFTLLERRRQRALAAGRGALSERQFTSILMAIGVREETAKFVWDEAKYYYFEPLKPHPEDRWEGTMRIDPGDLEDITAKYWKLHGWPEPTTEEPVGLPCDPTLLEYAQWLDHQHELQE